jgi:S1-C subfamily serine protease
MSMEVSSPGPAPLSDVLVAPLAINTDMRPGSRSGSGRRRSVRVSARSHTTHSIHLSRADVSLGWGWTLQSFDDGAAVAGLLVKNVLGNSVASDAMIKAGDIIVAIDG